MTPIEAMTSAIIEKALSKIFTSFPAEVIEYDANPPRAKIQPLIDFDGVKLDPIPSVPVQHPGGEDWVIVTKITKGTQGMVSVCMRDFSTWLYSSDKQTKRRFSPTDSFFIPGVRSENNAIPNLSNDGIQLRSKDGSRFLWMKDSGGLHTSEVIYCKKMVSEEDCTAKGEVLARISHTHPYIALSGSTDNPVNKDTDQAEQD